MPHQNSYYCGEPLTVGNQWNLLVDDAMVEDAFRLERRLIKPVKHPKNPILMRDQPWEGTSIGPCSVLWDPDYERFRMWYRCANLESYQGAPGPPYYIAYAESDDGLHWEKPILENCIPIPGYERTNIVYTGTFYARVQGPQVWCDEQEGNEARRYKMLTLERRPDADGNMISGVQLAYSPDGFRWSLDENEKPLIGYHSDCQNHIVRAPDERHWLLYCRPISLHAGAPAKGRRPDLATTLTGPRRHSGRRVAVAVSEDLTTWSYPRTVLFPDEHDAPDIDQCCVFRSGSCLVMLYADMDGDDTGRNRVKLATSGDGFHWHRFHTREPFIDTGIAGSWEGGSVSTGNAPLRLGGRLLHYYNGRNLGQHEEGEGIGGIGVACGTANRFVEYVGGDPAGYLLTREFILEGDRLEMNTTRWNGAGNIAELRVEIVRHLPVDNAEHAEDRGDTVVPGFSLADCDPINVDRSNVEVTWNGSGDLSSLQGQPVYLRFYLKNKGLCAFRIVNSDIK